MRAIVLGRALGDAQAAPPATAAELVRQLEAESTRLPGIPPRTERFDPSRMEAILDDFQRTRFRLLAFVEALPVLESPVRLDDRAALDERIRLVDQIAGRLALAAQTTADDLAPSLWNSGELRPDNDSPAAQYYRFGVTLRDVARQVAAGLMETRAALVAAASRTPATPASPPSGAFTMPQPWTVPTEGTDDTAAIAVLAIVALAASRRRR